jgi:long-chain acyl-CoA synthetase
MPEPSSRLSSARVARTPSSTEPFAAGHAAARLARQLDHALADVDLSLPQYRLLVYLTLGESKPSDLAPRLGITRPSVTALVDGMVARGLVDRQPDTDDRRRVHHRVTPAGRDALAAADRGVDERLRELASHLSPDDAARAFEGLALWNEAVASAAAAVARAAQTGAAR